MNTYFMGDPHIEHEGVLAMSSRPFDSIEEHNDHIIEVTNLKVRKKDRLFIMGDFAWHSERSWFKKFNCENIHLIIGNHDRAGVMKCFKTVNDVLELKMKYDDELTERIWLSHYPHAYWPGSHKGWYHLYGHCHHQREATLDSLFPGRRSMDVGVDSYFAMHGYYSPWSWDEVRSLLVNRTGHDNLDHYKQYQAQLGRWLNVGKTREVVREQIAHEVYNLKERYADCD